MANRPQADKDAKPKQSKPAAKKSSSKTASGAPKAGPQEADSGRPAEHLQEGVARMFSRGRDLLAKKGPGFLDTVERTTIAAIDHAAKGIDAFEKGANHLEGKIGAGLKEMLERRRTQPKESKPKSPRR